VGPSSIMGNNKMYISLPPPQKHPQKAGGRRPPLTPSTVSPPSLTAQTSSAARQEMSRCASPKATALLARVASSPPSPRTTPMSSPLPSPYMKGPPLSRSAATSPRGELPPMPKREYHEGKLDRESQDGYISFPDFERFREAREAGRGHDEAQAAYAGA